MSAAEALPGGSCVTRSLVYCPRRSRDHPSHPLSSGSGSRPGTGVHENVQQGDRVRDEYEFDYSRARPNRFAARMDRPVVAVVLEADVASVFNSSAKVNAQLRSIPAARRPRRRPSRVRSHRRKAG